MLRITHVSALALIATFISFASSAKGMPASPHPYTVRQPDGTLVSVYVRGDEFFHWEEDAAGYTLVRDRDGVLVYAALDAQGNLAPTKIKAGIDDPTTAGLNPGILPPLEVRIRKRAQLEAKMQNQEEAVAAAQALVTGTVKNIVIMMRFNNHLSRTLPTNGDINTIFNNVGPHALAPTGSVRDVYLENSYGQMTLNSSVYGWVDLPQSEQFYAAGNSGLGLSIWGAITAALDAADPLIDFSQFDDDSNGWVDAIAFIHSGYGAEWGGTDADGTHYTNRIWSHRWSIPTWTSAEGVRVSAYHISPGLWATSGSAPGRIGVICHETGHFFGLPDLYDTDGVGEGIGSYCMMANSWGFDFSQYHPPHFSAWSKIFLGWLTPTLLSAPGTYSAQQIEQFPQVYRIDAGNPSGEYLLIENRQPYGFENVMPQGGLCIWHIDEGKCCNTEEGWPGQPGWPGNNRHYRIALLQADGQYQLERGGFGRGDAGDVYRGGGVSRIDGATIPNTHAYQGGVVTPTHHRIRNISASGAKMTFDFDAYVPATGACCNDLSGVCMNNQASAACMQSGGSRFVEGGSCGTLVPSCVASAPPNDNCANAIPIYDGFTFFDTRLAGTDGPPDCLNFDPDVGNQDIWYVYNATCSGDLLVTECPGGTNYDATLQIYAGTSCAPLGTRLDCGDDDCGIGAGPAELFITAVESQPYLLRVGGWGGSAGTGRIDIQCTPVCGDGVISGAEQCDPPNDAACPGQCAPNCTCGSSPGIIEWDASDMSPDRATRSLRFKVVAPATANATSGQDAIKVTMVDLQHPDPRNAPQYPPPNFSTFDTGTHGTCAGGDFAGHHCDDNADCQRALPSGVDGICSLPGPACTAAGELNGCARWVGRPATFYESQGPPLAGPYRAARLQCTPLYWDWITETSINPISVVGAEIVPSSEYSVRTYAASCKGLETGCANLSNPVGMYTRRSGDVDEEYNPPSATNQPNAIDVAQLVNTFKYIAGAPVHARAQLQPNLPELNASVNALDIVAVVDAVKGFAYAFSGPCPCPSTVTCGGSCTGCPGMCVKTCTGGENAGEPCLNNNHCPSGACAAVGTCRDLCGRCKP